ncbi:hypothetical protein B0H21DRAFT_826329 [Amylocystis lapponica]|nr:hypothetical protein B0H21DRAFT_826329 [Amylocystis lapponica]
MPPTYTEPSQPLVTRAIQGTVPSILDPTQPKRLLRHPSSKLLFASYNPLTATPRVPGLSAQHQPYNSKHIVIEITSGSTDTYSWRFVPRAHQAEGIEDEGLWPRDIEICGEVMYCSKDQWDIYKLDPDYDCFVDTPPRKTVICRKESEERTDHHNSPTHPANTFPSSHPLKCRRSSPETITLHTMFSSVNVETDGLTEDIDDEMNDQEEMTDLTKQSDSSPESRLQSGSYGQLKQPPNFAKRRVSSPPRKHVRRKSPTAGRNAIRLAALRNTERRKKRDEAHMDAWKTYFDTKLLRNIMADVPTDQLNTPSSMPTAAPPPVDIDDDPAHRAALEEREEKEKRTADTRRREEEARARQAATEQHRREAEAREKDRAQRLQQQRCRQWAYGDWTVSRALEHYNSLCDDFDKAKFTAANPASVDVMPWPVLCSPLLLELEDIQWSAVEAFFRAAKNTMQSQDFKKFIDTSHKRFHPDRWSARGVLKSVDDPLLRDRIEVALNTVTQALTPLWEEGKGC